jgi:glycosyltransferase involved in cell wall biosynthesis/GT2 family glycosyltransferase
MPADHSSVAYAETLILQEAVAAGLDVDCYLAGEANAIPPSLMNKDGLRFFCEPVDWNWGHWYSRTPLSSFVTGQWARARAQRRLGPLLQRQHAANPYDVLLQFSQIELFFAQSLLSRLPPLVLYPSVHAAGELHWHRRETRMAQRCEPRLWHLACRGMLTARSTRQRRDVRSGEMVIALSKRFGRYLSRDYGVPAERIRVLPYPIDLERFLPPAERETPTTEPLTLLFASRMSVRKGVEMVVALSHRLADLAGEVRIEAVGGETLWSRYAPLLAELNRDIASYHGAVENQQLADLYRHADLLLQPSHYEPFALTVGEGLASGLPVVASDEVGATEEVDPVCCRVFRAGDLDGFEHQVRTLVSRLRTHERTQIKAVARSEAQRLFAPSSIAERLMTYLEELRSRTAVETPEGRRRMSVGAISVVVPTYRRPAYLARCLEALREQSVRPSDVVVVRRHDDAETAAALSKNEADGPADVVVREVGVVAALSAGTRATSGDIVAFVDDDAVPHRDWLERLLSHFRDPEVGGVGGRDIIQDEAHSRLPLTTDVGRIGRWGKMRGNHHLGTGPPRDVMVLKGANMAFRREAIAFALGLRGEGAQVHFEVAMCLWARARGWRLVYDPSAVVDHYIGPRFGTDRRGRPESAAVRDAAYNYVAALLGARSELLWRRAVYGLLVGDRSAPGLVRAGAAVLKRERDVVRRLVPSLCGQTEALWRAARGRSISMVPVTTTDRDQLPRVALVAHDVHDHGGMEKAFAELIRLGHPRVRFVVVSRRLAPDLRPLVDWRRIRVPARPFPLKFSLFFLLAATRLLCVRADLVHTMGAIVPNRADLATVQFCHAAFRRIASRRSTGHSSASRRLNTAISSLLSVAAERWVYRPDRIGALAAVSAGVGNELNHHYPNVSVFLTPNGVDLDRFHPDTDVRQRFRRQLRVTEDDVVVLFVGGDWERKGLAEVIEGIARARVASRARLQLWVVGTGDIGRYRRFARRHGIDRDDVRFFGPRMDVERVYQAADIFVTATLYETFSLAAHEAASCSIPIVGTPVSGIGDLVGNDEAGLRVDRNPDALAQAIAILANDPEMRARMGRQGRRRVAQLTWQRSVDSVLGCYLSLVHTPRRFREAV